jgi:hypothetical protein
VPQEECEMAKLSLMFEEKTVKEVREHWAIA